MDMARKRLLDKEENGNGQEFNLEVGGQKLRTKNMRITDIVLILLLALLTTQTALWWLHRNDENSAKHHTLEVLERGVVAQMYTACIIGIPPEYRWEGYRKGEGDRCAWILQSHSNQFFGGSGMNKERSRSQQLSK